MICYVIYVTGLSLIINYLKRNLVGGCPYWAAPLQACSTLTYALITTEWSRLTCAIKVQNSKLQYK